MTEVRKGPTPRVRFREVSALSPGQTDSQVDESFRLAFLLATHLRRLALTLVELKFVRKSPFGRPTKSTQVDRKSTVYA